MPSKVIASHRNKDYITQVVTAFNERDIPSFTRLFSLNADPAVYKQIQGRKTPSDYALLSEVMNNVGDDFIEDDACALLLSLSETPGLSELARLGIYFSTFAYVPEQDREKVFGDQSTLRLDKGDFEAINAYFNTYDGDEFYTGRHDIEKFYRQSVIKDQSPKDFLLNIEVCARVGINFLGELSRLRYEDKPDGPSAHEQYQGVLGYLNDTVVTNMLGFMKPSALTFDMVKKHNLTYAHPVNEFCAIFLPQAFARDDLDVFRAIFIGNANSHTVEGVANIHKEMTHFALQNKLTGPQKDMFQLVDVVQKSHERWVARSDLFILAPSALTYDQVKEYQLIDAKPANEFIDIFVPQVFDRGDVDLFDLIFRHHANTGGPESAASISKLLTVLSSKGEPTGPQKEMLELVKDYQEAFEKWKIQCREPHPCRPDGEFGPTP